MRRTIAIAVLACTLAGCKDFLGIGGSDALYDIRAHTHSAYTDTDHPAPQPTWTEDHDYDGRLLLARTGNELRVVLTLRECLQATGCSARTFRSHGHATQSEGGPRYDGGTTFYTTVSADDERSPGSFDISGDIRPGGFTGRLNEVGGRRAALGTFVATPR